MIRRILSLLMVALLFATPVKAGVTIDQLNSGIYKFGDMSVADLDVSGSLQVDGAIYGDGSNLTGVVHSEVDTLQSVTDRGASTTNDITVDGALTLTGLTANSVPKSNASKVIVDSGIYVTADGALYVGTGPTYVDGFIYGNGSQLTGITTPSLWTESGADIYRATGNVGIGTNTPVANRRVVIEGTGWSVPQLRIRNATTYNNRYVDFYMDSGGTYQMIQANGGAEDTLLTSNANTVRLGGYQSAVISPAQTVIIGPYAGKSLTSTGINSTLVGQGAGYNITTGDYNSCLGSDCLYNTAGNQYNTSVGATSLRASSAGDSNVAIGYRAGTYYGSATATSYLTSVSQSVFLGADARASANTNANEIVIGYNAYGSGSNTATIGNLNNTKLVVNGTLEVSGTLINVGGADIFPSAGGCSRGTQIGTDSGVSLCFDGS